MLAGRRAPALAVVLGLAPGAREPDVRERDADLAEGLDRDEEAGEQQDHGDELGDRERPGDAEPVQRVAGRGDEAAGGDQQRRRDAAVEPAAEQVARARPGSEATKFTGSATSAISRLNRKWSPFWLGSRE